MHRNRKNNKQITKKRITVCRSSLFGTNHGQMCKLCTFLINGILPSSCLGSNVMYPKWSEILTSSSYVHKIQCSWPLTLISLGSCMGWKIVSKYLLRNIQCYSLHYIQYLPSSVKRKLELSFTEWRILGDLIHHVIEYQGGLTAADLLTITRVYRCPISPGILLNDMERSNTD